MASKVRPLVVIADDDPDVIDLLTVRIESWDYRVAAARSKTELMTLLLRERPVLVLLDLRFGETDGLELLRQLLDASPDLPVALLTGHGSIDLAVHAMRLGAYDFLTKPPDSARLRVLISHAVEKRALAERITRLESLAASVSPGLRLIGDSAAMRSLMDLLRSVAPTDATVLILGESGTGKELVAQTVHDLSRRKDGPFVPLNMAALPKELAESLLFGHEKGAFTGADRAQAGACELADGGTLFLDEIGELELGLQAKLLRFLQERTVQRVGNPKPIKVDVRVVAATNRDLADRVRSGAFREDLYYRLNVVPVRIPSLRERRDDIPLLAARFLERGLLKYRRTELAFTPAAIASLTAYDWPGNVRQLENLVERLAILTRGPEIGPEALAEEFRTHKSITTSPLESPASITNPMAPASPLPTSGGEGLRLVDQLEKQAIIDALTQAAGNVGAASQILGLSQATIYRKLKRYEIDPRGFTRLGK